MSDKTGNTTVSHKADDWFYYSLSVSFSPAGDCLNVGSVCVVFESLFWDFVFVFSLQECLSSVLTFGLRRQTVSLCQLLHWFASVLSIVVGAQGPSFAMEPWDMLSSGVLTVALHRMDLVESYNLSQPMSSERPYHWGGGIMVCAEKGLLLSALCSRLVYFVDSKKLRSGFLSFSFC